MFLSGRHKIPALHIMNKKKAIILLSGGLDSATTLYYAKARGYDLHALSFDYKQRHKKELNCAKTLAGINKISLQILKVSLPWKGSSLIDNSMEIPRSGIAANKTPNTYVPARNIIFLSYAASYAESIKASKIFIGANQIDYSGYPDCRQDFLNAFAKAIEKGTMAGCKGKKIEIAAPLIKKSKKDIITEAVDLGVPLEHTWSCYEGLRFPCGKCPSCVIRRQGFAAASVEDPLAGNQ
jgi:7-cyano-7-deazaguanine synthase